MGYRKSKQYFNIKSGKSMEKLIAAIDQGTTSTRCMLFNRQGEILIRSQKEHKQIYPKAGWVEHDPLEIWQRTQEVISDVISDTKYSTGSIQAIGITNQRETTVIWDKRTGQPFHNAVVWQDTRTDKICQELAQDGGIDRFRSTVGLPLSTYFSGPKIKWLLDNGSEDLKKEALNGNAYFGTIDTWLIWWLTGGPNRGVFVTDVTNASRTMLMDLATLDWDPEILRILNIPRSMLPKITPSSDPMTWGTTLKTGPFKAEIPVCGNLGDQQAALVGQACFTTGDVKNTYGTGCFLLMNTGHTIHHSTSGLLTTLGYKFGNKPPVYAIEGSIAIAGALVQWLRDNLGVINNSSEIEDLARLVEDNGGAYIVPAFSGLFAPYWRPDARGVIVGLTRYVNKNHLARAALESTAYQTRDVINAMESDTNIRITGLKVDGGMVVNEFLMQFQSDILNVPVIRPKNIETTALGAAYAAGLAVNYWYDEKGLLENWQPDRVWTPEMTPDRRSHLVAEWSKAIGKSLDWFV
jgi:glycerol kinase